MEKEKEFIETILLDAEKESENITKQAKEEALNITKQKEEEEKEFFKTEKKKITNEFSKLLENEKDVALLEQNKEVLKAKNEILSSIVELALQKLKKLPVKDEENFVKNVLSISCK